MCEQPQVQTALYSQTHCQHSKGNPRLNTETLSADEAAVLAPDGGMDCVLVDQMTKDCTL